MYDADRKFVLLKRSNDNDAETRASELNSCLFNYHLALI